ncbi:uncharacterized protein TM35_000211800 [Trypanosoma theileri]|uniref:Uncharacterized protein n=1 Tax=Trypanosoma theileri TaxID=67003 RepID=A0A1X0NSA3_9TRYP|nr:uncharacterized protein TM35_000211800 [Trypanosoma theileri]ORC87574.1 hypothetical protein TM35_000211800 [Trypanosoma theileri]
MHGARSNNVKRRENPRSLGQPLPIPSVRRGISLSRGDNNIPHHNNNSKNKENNNNNNNKDVHHIVRLPKLQKRNEEPFISELTIATQKLRRTIMNQTGSHISPGGMYNETFSNTDMCSAMDTLLGTGTIYPDATEAWHITQTLQNISVALSLGTTHDAGVMNPLSTPSLPLPNGVMNNTTGMGDTLLKQSVERPVLAMTMVEVPWYKPPLKLQLLQQSCCYPDDTRLFRRRGMRKFSTASICSNAASLMSNTSSSSASSSSSSLSSLLSTSSLSSVFSPSEHHHPHHPHHQQHREEEKKKRKSGKITLHKLMRKDIQALSSQQRFRYMRAQRFINAINSWCTVVSRVPLTERDNPSELHETCMMLIYKEEERLILAKSLIRHQALQKRERHRLARQIEEQEKARDEVAQHERMMKQNRWKTLLRPWTNEEGIEEKAKGDEGKEMASPEQQEEEQKKELMREEYHATAQLLQLVPQSTDPSVIQQSIAQRILTSPVSNEMRLIQGSRNGSYVDEDNNNNNKSRMSSINSTICSTPLQKLHLLIEKIARSYKGKTSDVKKSSDIKHHFHKVFDTFRQFREGILFAPSSSVYKEINWVERVIQNNDFSTLKEITQNIVKHINATDTLLPGVIPSLQSQRQPQRQSSLFLLDRNTKNITDSLVQVDASAIPSTQEMLFPIRLYFDSHSGRMRVVTVDGLTLSGISQSSRQGNTPSATHQGTVSNSNKSNVGDNKVTHMISHVDNTHMKEDTNLVSSSFDLHTFLSSTNDILGEPPRRYEVLVAYSIDTAAIVRQSQWRAAMMKQLANEESVEVHRCILARVIVALSIHTVVSTGGEEEEVKNKTRSPSEVPEGEGGGKEEEEKRRSQATSISLSISPSLLHQENERQQQQQQQYEKPLQLMNHEKILAAPTQRNHYVLDVQQLYFVAASALMENNETILPSLQRLRVQYHRLAAELIRNSEGHQPGDFTYPSSLPFTQTDVDCIMEQLSNVISLLQLETTYGEQLAALHRNECAVLHYNCHVSPYREFLRAEQALWAPLYLRTLRLAHTFCVLLAQLGTLPIPPRYRPFLGPVLQLLNCHGGQKELRLCIDECLLELEERGKRVRMPLLQREVQANAQMELDTAAAAVEAGYCSPEQIITCLAVPEDVVGTEPELLTMPTMLFVDVPPITG